MTQLGYLKMLRVVVGCSNAFVKALFAFLACPFVVYLIVHTGTL